jgi:hypothetical protein
MAVAVPMRTSLDLGRHYGADEARVFLDQLLPAAPDVPVQIAHLAGAGGYDADIDSALGVFTDAIASHDARMKNVWFDVAAVVRPEMTADELKQIAGAHPPAGVRTRVVRLGCGRESSRLAQGRLGGVSTAAADRGRVQGDRQQRRPLHA